MAEYEIKDGVGIIPDAPLAGLLFSLEQDVWAETLCNRQDGSVNQLRQEYKRGSCRHSHQENGLDAWLPRHVPSCRRSLTVVG